MDAQKRFFLIMGVVIVTLIAVLYFTVGEDDEQQLIVDGPINTQSVYDEKLKAAKKSGVIEDDLEGTGTYFEADSVLEDGQIHEHPKKRQKREEDIAFQRQSAELSARFEQVTQHFDEFESPPPRPQGRLVPRPGTPANYESTKPTIEHTQSTAETDKERRRRSFAEYGSEETGVICVVHRTQEVQEGSKVTLRVTQNCMVGDLMVFKNTMLYATVSISRNRAQITLGALKVKGVNYAVSLVGYGEDGSEGVPLDRDVVKKEVRSGLTDAALNEVQNAVSSVVGSVGRSAGNFARNLVRGSERREANTITFIDNQKITFQTNSQ